MTTSLLDRYDQLKESLHAAKGETATAKSAYDAALANEAAIESDITLARAELAAKLGGAATAPSTPRTPRTEVAHPSGTPVGIRPSVWVVLTFLPREGGVHVEAIRTGLGLTTSALNTRLGIARDKGWAESAGWGQWRLTEAGRALQAPKLQVVSTQE